MAIVCNPLKLKDKKTFSRVFLRTIGLGRSLFCMSMASVCVKRAGFDYAAKGSSLGNPDLYEMEKNQGVISV